MKYDSSGWWSEIYHQTSFPCTTSLNNPSKVCFRKGNGAFTSSRTSAVTIGFELMGTANVIQLARKILWYQKEKKNSVTKSPLELIYSWDGVSFLFQIFFLKIDPKNENKERSKDN